MNARDFAGWWNWIFVAPFIVGALMVALSVFGLADDDGDAAGDDDGFFEDILENLHLNGVPPLMLLQNFGLWWGLCGWSVNRILGRHDAGVSLFSIPAALIGGVGLSLMSARLLSRFTPSGATATHQNELEGQIGESAALISQTAGTAYVRDTHGTLHQIAARVGQGTDSIQSGQPILVIHYQERDQCFRVQEWKSNS